VDAAAPATMSAAVATVESIRNMAVGSVTISTARLAVSSRKMPAHSQVALWKKRCRARVVRSRLPQRDYFSRQLGDERVRAGRCPGEQDAHREVCERQLQEEEPEVTVASTTAVWTVSTTAEIVRRQHGRDPEPAGAERAGAAVDGYRPRGYPA
jgi:hypothetical protein